MMDEPLDAYDLAAGEPAGADAILQATIPWGKDFGSRLVAMPAARLAWLGRSCKSMPANLRSIAEAILIEAEAQGCGPRSENSALIQWPIVVRLWREEMIRLIDARPASTVKERKLAQALLDQAARLIVVMFRGDEPG
jgi:hypothetical protein